MYYYKHNVMEHANKHIFKKELHTYKYTYTHTYIQTNIRTNMLTYIYTGCYTTLGDFLGLVIKKISYKHVSEFGRLRSYDRLNLGIEDNDY